MKAVVYHADSHFAWGPAVGDLYAQLFPKFIDRCHRFGFEKVIHLNLEGFPEWGDETINYKGYEAKDVMYNRELIFADFLENAPDDVYWFGEPDYVFFKKWPVLSTDLALLYRHGDSVPMTPGWRLARPKASPIFREIAEIVKEVPIGEGIGRDWHCDSVAFVSMWKRFGKPKEGHVAYKGISVEMRVYKEYVKPGVYCRNYNGPSKHKLIDQIP